MPRHWNQMETPKPETVSWWAWQDRSSAWSIGSVIPSEPYHMSKTSIKCRSKGSWKRPNQSNTQRAWSSYYVLGNSLINQRYESMKKVLVLFCLFAESQDALEWDKEAHQFLRFGAPNWFHKWRTHHIPHVIWAQSHFDLAANQKKTSHD